jgi:hypothetical protein
MHFSSHQFEVATKGDCEVVIHGIMCTLDFYPNWVFFQLNMANTFNLVSKEVIFQKNCVVGGDIMQLIPFVRAFYAFEFPLFYNHCNHEGYVIIIPFTMGTRLDDPLGGPLFASTHFRVLHSTTSHFFLV